MNSTQKQVHGISAKNNDNSIRPLAIIVKISNYICYCEIVL